VRAKKGALRAKGLSAWTYEKKLESLASKTDGLKTTETRPTPVATPSASDQIEVKAIRERVQNLEDRAEAIQRTEKDLQAERDRLKTLEAQVDRMQSETVLRVKAAEDAEKARSADRDAQREEARLLKRLVEDIQAGQKRLEASLATVDKKAEEKGIGDEELRQSLSIMRKDLRDNVQDISVIKQKVEKLMAPEKTYARPLDKALSSKWLPGAALLIAVGAVVITASKK
jgi:chromosome segregation ATPase